MSQAANVVRSHKERWPVDIAGAKALKERLGRHGAAEAPPAAGSADVPVDAPPVYHWTGVGKARDEAPSPAEEEDSGTQRASWFRRLAPSFR